jgi:hypothetical protein
MTVHMARPCRDQLYVNFLGLIQDEYRCKIIRLIQTRWKDYTKKDKISSVEDVTTVYAKNNFLANSLY